MPAGRAGVVSRNLQKPLQQHPPMVSLAKESIHFPHRLRPQIGMKVDTVGTKDIFGVKFTKLASGLCLQYFQAYSVQLLMLATGLHYIWFVIMLASGPNTWEPKLCITALASGLLYSFNAAYDIWHFRAHFKARFRAHSMLLCIARSRAFNFKFQEYWLEIDPKTIV